MEGGLVRAGFYVLHWISCTINLSYARRYVTDAYGTLAVYLSCSPGESLYITAKDTGKQECYKNHTSINAQKTYSFCPISDHDMCLQQSLDTT